MVYLDVRSYICEVCVCVSMCENDEVAAEQEKSLE